MTEKKLPALYARDLARLRTEARLLELAFKGLIADAYGRAEKGNPAEEALRAVVTAHEFVVRCQTALNAALAKLPGSTEYDPNGSH